MRGVALLGEPDLRGMGTLEPDAGLSFSERMADWAATGETEAQIETRLAAFDHLVQRAGEETRLARLLSSRTEALADAAQNRIDTVQRVAGVALENPFRQGYYLDAERRYDDARARGEDPGPRAIAVRGFQRDIFNEKLDAASQAHPDKAAALQFLQPLEEQAGAIATSAESAAARSRKDFATAGGGVVGGFAAELLGGLAGMRRDPASVMSLFFGPGAAAGRTMLGRVFSAATKQGAFNVGLLALEKPAARDWRAERRLDPGSAVPDVAETGLAFALGFIPGAAIQGAIEASSLRAFNRVMAGEARPGDIERAIRALGGDYDPEIGAALEQGRRSAAADNASVAERPADAADFVHERAVAQAIGHAADPAQASPPPAVPVIGRGVTDEAADAVMRAAESPLAGVEALRVDQKLVQSALSSERDDLQIAGRLATLSDEALTHVREGGADPLHAAAVAEMTPRLEWHAEMLESVTRASPADMREARLVAADALEALALAERDTRARLADRIDRSDRVVRAPEPAEPRLKPSQAVEPGTPEAQAAAEIAAAEVINQERVVVARQMTEEAAAARAVEIERRKADLEDMKSGRIPDRGVDYFAGNRELGETADARLARIIRQAEGRLAEIEAMPAQIISPDDPVLKIRYPDAAPESKPLIERLAIGERDDPLDMVPSMRDDGSAHLLPRDAAARAGERDRLLADLVRSCK